MNKNWCCFIFAFTLLLIHPAYGQVNINSFDDIISLVKKNNYTLKNGYLELSQARKAKLAALISVPDPTGSASLGYTNNTRLPVSLFPAEIIGGTPGTFEPVQLGLQYVSDFTTSASIKIINPAGWQNLRLSKINRALVSSNNLLTTHDVLDNAATVYFNLLTLEAQRQAAQKYLNTADTLYLNVLNRFNTGLASQQELNDVKISKFQQSDNLQQIGLEYALQLDALKALVNTPDADSIIISETNAAEVGPIEPLNLRSQQINATLKYQYGTAELRREKLTFLPTLSFDIGYQSQLFDEEPNPFRTNRDWIESNYYGFRLTLLLPSSNQVGNYTRLKFNQRMLANNIEEAIRQDEIATNRLRTSWLKAQSAYSTAKAVVPLQRESYEKNLLNYNAGIVSLESVIDSFNRLVDAEFEAVSAYFSLQLQAQRIKIKNQER